MSLTRALDAQGNDVLAALITPEKWDELRSASRSMKTAHAVFCPGCEDPVHWRRMPKRGIPYFHHNPGSGCDWAKPESEAHVGTKNYIVEVVSNLMPNWRAKPEEVASTSTGEAIRVDVAVTWAGKTQPRVGVPAKWAYEVQQSAQSAEVTERRSRQRRAAGYEGIQWVLPEVAPWLGISRDHPGIVDVDGYVTHGFAQPEQWPVALPATLADAIRRCHSGRYLFTEFGLVPDGAGGLRPTFAWVPTDWVSSRPQRASREVSLLPPRKEGVYEEGYCGRSESVVAATPSRNALKAPAPCIMCSKPTLRLTPSGPRHAVCEPIGADPWGIGRGRHKAS